MREIIYLIVIVFLLQTVDIFAQSSGPKREFRGAWIATVANIDWPTRGASTESQKQSLINILDALKAVNINAVMFQVRPESDALYYSSIEPWSYWLTGIQGQAPNPFYDPLQFAIDEAHKRGIELHAWLNPYRAKHASYDYSRTANHVTNAHPEWIITQGTSKIVDPGIPAARNYVVSVFMDIVRRYEVDGIHIDDYFYVEGITTHDAATYAAYGSGFSDIGDWRRNNVNTLVKMVSDSIKAVKPWVKWGVSPRGIWRPGYPPGITGNDNYNSIFCDAMAWLRTRSVDYINPQLYWAFGGGQDYGKLMPWWADSAGANGRHMYVGLAVYRINAGFNAAEVPKQMRLNRTDTDCQGSVLYNTNTTLLNPLGFYDSLKVLYKYPALPPLMNWKEQIKPNPPTNLKFDKIAGIRGDGLLWSAPSKASDGDGASRYVVYKFNTQSPQPSDLEVPSNLNNIVGTTYSSLKSKDDIGTFYFAVTSLDKNNNESVMSQVIQAQIQTPLKPLVISPADLAVNQKDTVKFIWENTAHSNFNRLQIASDQNFTNFIINQNNIADTFKSVTGFNGLSTYYWRITASNLAGESVYSDVRSFTTGFPMPPQLLLPGDKLTGISLTPTLVWKKSIAAERYRLQVAQGISILPSITILDTVVTDTSFVLSTLKEGIIYTWSVMAINNYGSSALAEVFKFKTTTASDLAMEESIPTSYVLNQNYPNPFNPSTVISYQLPVAGYVSLKIFDILGREVATLVNEFQSAGKYNSTFSTLPTGRQVLNYKLTSGIYIYILRAGSIVLSKKMILIK